jgi:ABC-type lipoprotein release transport system permease subunit
MTGATLAIGLRLVRGSGRDGLARLALVAAGVGLGVALLLIGLGVGPALEARDGRERAREPAVVTNPSPESYLLQAVAFDRFHGRRLLRLRLAPVGPRPPLPPGLERLPRPGEVAVSPELARLLRSPEGALLRPRVPGRIVALIGKDGLAWPGELLAYGGAARAEATEEAGFYPVLAYRSVERAGPRVPAEIKLMILIAVLGLLVPTLAFVAASSRVAAAARERRLAAIRLVGATPGQARLLAAVESALAAAIGCVVGVALFFALRPFAAPLAPAGHELFASDLAPPVVQAIGLLLAVPLLAVGAALFALRRVELNPLGIVRRGRVRRAGPLRAVPLVLGFAVLGAAWLARGDVTEPSSRGDETLTFVLVGSGFVLVLLGVLAVTPWLSLLAARLIARRSQNVGTLIAARRLLLEPATAARLVSGAVLAVFVATVTHAFLPSLLGASQSQTEVVAATKPGTLFVGTGVAPNELTTALEGVSGVRTVAPLGAASALTPAPRSSLGGPSDVLVADCMVLNRVLIRPLPRCGLARGYRFVPHPQYAPHFGAATTVALMVDPDRSQKTVALRLPDTLTPAPARELFGDDVSVLLAPEIVPSGAALRTRLGLVATDGKEETVERVRNALARAEIRADVETAVEHVGDQSKEMRGVVALINLGTLLVLVIAAAGLLVASVDSVLERRRPLAVLAAVGTPATLLRRSVLLQSAIPLVCGLAVAASTALLTSMLILAVNGEALELPLRALGALTAIALLAVLGVVALTLPMLARSIRPETLRAE